MRLRFVLGVVVAGSWLGAAQGAVAEGLPPSLVCEFKSGTSSSYEAGGFKSAVSQPISLSVVGIDLDTQTAALSLPGATNGKLSVVRALNATHFIEVLVEGFMTVTTIYDRDASTDLYPAVHSRHMGILGAPLVAQYTGGCKAGTAP